MFGNTPNSLISADSKSPYVSSSFLSESANLWIQPLYIITEIGTHIINGVYASTAHKSFEDDNEIEQELMMWQAASSDALANFEAMLDGNS